MGKSVDSSNMAINKQYNHQPNYNSLINQHYYYYILYIIRLLMEISQPKTELLKCVTCQLDLKSENDYRSHYKSQLHRYNLKRKMVKLAPATAEQFQAKKVQQAVPEISQFYCNQCSKQFGSANTFNQHISTKKHDPNMKKVRKTDKVAFKFVKNPNLCLFCLNDSINIQNNLDHMSRQHSFFISQQKYCKDINGLILYLQEKIQVGFLCVFCDNKKAKDFTSGEALRKHMIDKGHCFMKTDEGFQEYQKFYDFTDKFKAKLLQQNKVVPGIQFEEVEVINYQKLQLQEGENQPANSEEEQDWESDSDQEEIQENTDTIKYRIMRPTLTSNDELLLPNGKILGHRKYRYLYRQYVRQYIQPPKSLLAIRNQQESNSIILANQNIAIKQAPLLRKRILKDKRRLMRVGYANNNMPHFVFQNPK